MREAQRVQDEARVAADLVRKQAVLRLTEEGHGVRTIAAMLGLSKSRVARIVRTGSHIIVATKNSPDDEYEKPRNVREMVERIWQAAAAVPPRSATE